MPPDLQNVLLGALIVIVPSGAGLIAALINSRRELIRQRTRVAEAETRAIEKGEELDGKYASFVLEQARKNDQLSTELRQTIEERRRDAALMGELKGTVASLQNQLNTGTSLQQQRDQRIGELDGLYKSQLTENKRLSEHITDVEKVARDLSSINATLRNERDRAVTENEGLLRRYSDLETRVQRLEWEKDQLVKAIMALGGTLPEGVQHGSGLPTSVSTPKTP